MFFSNYFQLPILIVLTIGISHSALAESLDGYCISKAGQMQRRKEIQNNSTYEALSTLSQSITFFRDGEKFAIVPNSTSVLLLRQEDQKVISRLEYFLEKDDSISSLYLTKDNRLFIQANLNNYMTKLDLDTSVPRLESPTKLPTLYRQRCSRFNNWLVGGCYVGGLSYSPTLDRVFIWGYRQTSWGWGGDFVHLEITSEQEKSVPDLLVNSDFLEDIPMLNGALFQSNSGEALFYDGSNVTNLSSYFPNQKRRKKSQRRNWDFLETSEGRAFFVDLDPRSKGSPFLMELKTGPNLTSIPIPKELENTWLKLFTLPNDSRLWGITRNSILAEIKGELQNVVIVPSSSYFVGPAYIYQLADGSLSFQVENKTTESTTNYFLKHASPTANCEVMLDADKPVLLDGD
jgi:hypothetical protein